MIFDRNTNKPVIALLGAGSMGTAIVRRIARLHGGEVTFEPVRPHGARFVLTLGEK